MWSLEKNKEKPAVKGIVREPSDFWTGLQIYFFVLTTLCLLHPYFAFILILSIALLLLVFVFIRIKENTYTSSIDKSRFFPYLEILCLIALSVLLFILVIIHWSFLIFFALSGPISILTIRKLFHNSISDKSKKSERPSNKKDSHSTHIVTIFVIGIAVVLIFGLLFLIFMSMFWIDVTFENASDEDVLITPIGIAEEGINFKGEVVGNRIAPIYSLHGSGLLPRKISNTQILLDKKTMKLEYDMDDQNIQFIIVEYSDGDTRIVKMDADHWENKTYYSCCWAPRNSSYSIPPRAQLPPCPEILKPTIDGEYISVTDELIDILDEIPAPDQKI